MNKMKTPRLVGENRRIVIESLRAQFNLPKSMTVSERLDFLTMALPRFPHYSLAILCEAALVSGQAFAYRRKGYLANREEQQGRLALVIGAITELHPDRTESFSERALKFRLEADGLVIGRKPLHALLIKLGYRPKDYRPKAKVLPNAENPASAISKTEPVLTETRIDATDSIRRSFGVNDKCGKSERLAIAARMWTRYPEWSSTNIAHLTGLTTSCVRSRRKRARQTHPEDKENLH